MSKGQGLGQHHGFRCIAYFFWLVLLCQARQSGCEVFGIERAVGLPGKVSAEAPLDFFARAALSPPFSDVFPCLGVRRSGGR